MRKKISFMLALALTVFASVITSHAAAPVVYDFTTEGIACVGDSVSGDAQFFGKSKRFDYDYVNGVSKLIYTAEDGLNNPYLTNPNTNIDASVYKFVKIAYWTKVEAGELQFYFDSGSGITDANKKAAPITSDGSWQYAVIDMSDVATWTGTIKQIRYDFLYNGTFKEGDYVYCGYIALFDSADAANAYNVTLPDMAAFEEGRTEDPGFTLNNTKYVLTDDFSIELTFRNVPATDTWFGLYPASTPEAINGSHSIGVWWYTSGSQELPAALIKDGTLTITKENCEDFSKIAKGDYKIVMFKNGSGADTYTILDTKTFTFVDEGTPVDPGPTPPTGDAGLILSVAALVGIAGAMILCLKKRNNA